MKLYMAPMEGLTGFVYRRAYHRHFHNIDRYFTPFIKNRKLNHKELADILPENNPGMEVVPQILTNRAEDFTAVAEELERFGYRRVNLNLGCPSGTVVSKNRGAGMLSDPEGLDRFLDAVFSSCPLAISVKTRIGRLDWDGWEQLLSVYNRYPLEELIVHPRIQKDFYKNTPNWEAFQMAVELSRHSLCYNGDVFTPKKYDEIMARFPGVDKVMLGRGILMNPGLAGEIRGEGPVTAEELRSFHDEILEGWSAVMSEEKNTLFRMKELWSYMGEGFPAGKGALKKIRKAVRLVDYQAAVAELFETGWMPGRSVF